MLYPLTFMIYPYIDLEISNAELLPFLEIQAKMWQHSG